MGMEKAVLKEKRLERLSHAVEYIACDESVSLLDYTTNSKLVTISI